VTTTVRVSQDENVTMVQCKSTHLTSFAVLSMNVTGTRIVSTWMSYAASYLLRPLYRMKEGLYLNYGRIN